MSAAAQRDPFEWIENDGTPDERAVLEHLNEVAPLFDVQAARFGRFLVSDPPEQRMLIPDFLPLGVVGLLASMGGAGKSVLAYQLGMSVATGLPFLGMPIGEAGGALYLAGEDDEGELHRRGRRLLEHYEAAGRMDRGALSDRLHIVSRVAEDNMLTAGREGEVVRTHLADRLISAAQKIPDLKLILIDPASRFKGGNANAEADSTRFVEVLESIRAETGATLLAAIHVNKASIKESGDADQSMIRGSTALVDGVRWVAAMQRLRRDAAKDYGVDQNDAGRYVRLDLVKSNYTRPWAGLWLHREAGGVLVPTTLEAKVEARREAQAMAEYETVLGRLHELLRTEGAMSPNRIETRYSGKAGVLGVGLHKVRSVIERALHEGDLTESTSPSGGRLLNVPGGAS